MSNDALPVPGFATLIEAMAHHVAEKPDFPLFECIDTQGIRTHLTIAELHHKATHVARYLAAQLGAGARVLLPTNNELAFHVAFLGCLYAGCVGVPIQVPRIKPKLADLGLGRFFAVVKDCGARLALIDDTLLSGLAQFGQRVQGVMPGLKLVAVSEAEGEGQTCDITLAPVAPDSLAFLQYTSGSTSTPKGVMLTHGAIVSNQASMQRRFAIRAHSTSLSWLPLYHDMGLCSGFFIPIYLAMKCVILSPLAFIARPELWLAEISRHEDVLTGGPNFTFAHCNTRIKPEVLAHLDISRWRLAFCGAEPIRPAVIREFSDRFSACGFRPETFCPSYGLAEGTLFVSSKTDGETPVVSCFSLSALGMGKAVIAKAEQAEPSVELMSCGREHDDITVVIVDPLTLTPLEEGCVGELLVCSPGAGIGYWQKPAETAQTFGLKIAGQGEKKFFRTGDLGFKWQQELYISGRAKELIIINGVNYYPQDIEFTAQSVERSLATFKAACFSVDAEASLALIVEADAAQLAEPLAGLIEKIRTAIRLEHQLAINDILLVKPGVIPRTSSGKVQRLSCANLHRERFFESVLIDVPQGASA